MGMEQTRTGRRGPPSTEVQVLISMFAGVVLMTAVAVLVFAIEGGRPPRLGLAGPTWQWTGSTTGADEAPLTVPDPGAYAVVFGSDGTFAAAADCDEVSGTYRTVPAGRVAGGANRLVLEPASAGLASCGEGSLAGLFRQQLGSASRYVIAGSQLTITLGPHATMTFEAADAVESASPGA